MADKKGPSPSGKGAVPKKTTPKASPAKNPPTKAVSSGNSSEEDFLSTRTDMATSANASSYWEGVIAWLKEDKSIADWLSEDEVKSLVSLPEAQLELWKVATQYQGFDVKVVLKAMRSSYDAYTRTETQQQTSEILRVGDEQKEFKYSNKEKMMEDISFMIFLFSTRGSDWNKVRSKSIKIVQEIMDWMKEKYNIDTSKNLPGSSLRPEAITLPRVAACFPMKVCDYFHKGYGKPLCSVEELCPEAGLMTRVSKAILCSYFPACMPSLWVKQNTSIHYVPFYVAVLNDNVLHRSDKKFTPLQNMFSYYSASYKSNATPQKSRVAWCISRGLSNEASDGFEHLLLTVSDYCHTAIVKERSDDPGLKAVESQLESLV